MTDPDSSFSLVCRVQKHLCALPLEHVVEIMRPLATEAISGAPAFVSGVTIMRGAPAVVVDTARLLGAKEAIGDANEDANEDARPARFVAVRAGSRCIALAVDHVMGVRSIPRDSMHAVPRLLQEAGEGVIAALGLLDAELLLVLESARILPAAFLTHAMAAPS